MNRPDALKRLADETFDILILGGGATGLGAAVDAAARGYRTALIEAEDFAAATSSRSTKLIHGGVRYLRAGNIGLVREALFERSVLRRNAPHLVDDLAFVVPAYRRFDALLYGAGLAAYDVLAGRSDFPRSRLVSPSQARKLVPALSPAGLRGAVVYHDGRFDDARLALTLARTAVDRGAVLANYVRATAFVRASHGRIAGVTALERESGEQLTIRARVVINATGIFVDAIRRFDDPAARPLLAQSRGSHIVVGTDALGGAEAALLIPKTVDGRILFAIPWHDRILIGTTDVPAGEAVLRPHPSADEVTYLLATVNRYLANPLEREAILATFAGLRPLIRHAGRTTARLSREHLVDVSPAGLVTIAGGKWTTYRKMAQDAVDVAARTARLPAVRSPTAALRLHGYAPSPSSDSERTPRDDAMRNYGSDAAEVRALVAGDATLGELLHPRLPYTGAQVVYGVRAEMARTVDDVLARRTRALFLDRAAAHESAPRVASLMAGELGRDRAWESEQVLAFETIAGRTESSFP
jgi:glycerol-3-phosphate dehydrogenase